MSRPRSPSVLLRASIPVHVVAVGALLWRPETWPWVAGGVAVDHAALVAGSLWPKSSWVGPNLTRVDSFVGHDRVGLTFDDGPDPDVTPGVLDILRDHGTHATFFCVGRRAATFPDLVRRIVADGHRVENHSYAHPNLMSLMGPSAIARDVDRAQAVLTELSGAVPTYFRTPAGLKNPWLDRILRTRGLHLATWTSRGFDTVSSSPTRVLQRLTDKLAAGDILLLHDGNSARTEGGRAVVLDVLPALLDHLDRRGMTAGPLPVE